MKQVNVRFLRNGNTFVMENDEHVPELERSWFLHFVNFLDQSGVDVLGSTFVFPDGMNVKLHKNTNWNFEKDHDATPTR